MVSSVLGWLLVALGIASYVAGLALFIRSQIAQPAALRAQSLNDANLEVFKELLDKLSAILESFARLSVPVQWAVLGLLNIGVGAYLIANRPF
ncbi:MAG: hypothetical protein ACOYZ7_01625 [Chloroflexota bacterium]